MIGFYIDRVLEVELDRRAEGHVRFDPGGAIDHTVKPKRKGGTFTLRYSRRRAVEVTIWTELAHDIGRALNAAYWRKTDKEGH